MPDWEMLWQDVSKISVTKLPSGHTLMLESYKAPFKKRLLVRVWRTESELQQPGRWLIFSKLRQQREELKNMYLLPLPRYIKENVHINLAPPVSTSIVNFDLNDSLGTRIGVVIFMVIFADGMIDLVYNTEDYALSPPWDSFFIIGFSLSIASFIALNQKKIPKTVAIGLSLMLGGAGYFASYAALLRVNQFTDTASLQDHEYVIGDENTLKPVEPNLPEIKVDSEAFWKQPVGTPITVSLRKGGLGFYQMDKEDIYSQMRYWYCEQRVKEHQENHENCDDK